jgi:hypothetical protein
MAERVLRQTEYEVVDRAGLIVETVQWHAPAGTVLSLCGPLLALTRGLSESV